MAALVPGLKPRGFEAFSAVWARRGSHHFSLNLRREALQEPQYRPGKFAYAPQTGGDFRLIAKRGQSHIQGGAEPFFFRGEPDFLRGEKAYAIFHLSDRRRIQNTL